MAGLDSPCDGFERDHEYTITIEATNLTAACRNINDCDHIVGFGEPVTVTATWNNINGGTASQITAAEHQDLKRFIEENIVEAHEEDHPWLRDTWTWMNDPANNFEIEVGDFGLTLNGGVAFDCRSPGGSNNPLFTCPLEFLKMDVSAVRETLIIIHEMAHIYTFGAGVAGDGAAEDDAVVGALNLYFIETFWHLFKMGNYAPNRFCDPAELLADTLLHMVEPSTHLNYWTRCADASDTDFPTVGAIAAATDGVNGRFSDWFNNGHIDNPNAVWDIIKRTQEAVGYPREITTHHIRHLFGGYCKLSLSGIVVLDGGRTHPWCDRPSAPTDLSATAGDGSIDLAWSAPADDGNKDIVRYEIQWKSGDQEYDESSRRALVTDVSNRTAAITDLDNGVEVTIRIRAGNSIDATRWDPHSDWVETTSIPTADNARSDRPQALKGLQAVTLKGAVKITWEAPADPTVTGYRVERRLASDPWGWVLTLVENTGSTRPVYIDTTARAGIEYEYRVTALSKTDEGKPSEWLRPDQEAAPQLPPAPRNLTAAVNPDGSVTLRWDAPDDDSITGYRILRRRPALGETALMIYVEDTGDTGARFTDPDATPGVRHIYRVAALSGASESKRSNSAHADPPPRPDTPGQQPDDSQDQPDDDTQHQPALTAEFLDPPTSHTGAAFTLRIAFSDEIRVSYREVRDHAFKVTGGAVTQAWRVDGRRDLWEITVIPDSGADVVIVLAAGRACGSQGALCTADARPLSARLEVTIPGPGG